MLVKLKQGCRSMWQSTTLSFQFSDHATKLFKIMFPDSKIAKMFACSHTKTAAIITVALLRTMNNLLLTFQAIPSPFL